MNQKLLFLSYIFLLSIVSPQLFSQSENVSNDTTSSSFATIEEYLEAISSSGESIENLLETIDFFISNPIDISKSNPAQIAEVPSITYLDAYFIHSCVVRDSNVTYEYLASHLNLNEYQRTILELCTRIKVKEIKRFGAKARERSFYQLETAEGFIKNKYRGDKLNLYQKYQVNYNSDAIRSYAGCTINKNSGELRVNEFLSGYVTVEHQNAKLIIGDFTVNSGMGNIFGASFLMSKGVNIIDPTVSYSNKISPFTSKLDYRLMRGVTSQFNFPIFEKNRVSATTWYAKSPRSATFSKDSSYISSLFTTGTYKTENDFAKKNAIDEKNIGGILEFTGCNYTAGALLTYFDYGKEIRSTSSQAFVGQSGYMGSVFSSFTFNNVSLTSEISLDNKSYIGFKFGTAYKSNIMEVALHVRSFEEKFRSPYGSIFGEFSYPANELGIYSGIIWKPEKKYRFSAFFDWFTSYGNTYTVDTNVTGFDFFSQFDYIIDSRTTVYARLNYKSKTAQEKISKNVIFYQKDKTGIRLEGKHSFSKCFKLRSRLDFVYINNKNIIEDELGIAGFLESELKVTNWLKLQARATCFSTDSYNSAIWQFEYYYPGASYFPALYDSGTRAYIALQISPIKNLDIYLRYVNMYKFNVESLGSGYELIKGKQQNRIYCQIDLKI